MQKLIPVSVGLPNSCVSCGQPVKDTGFSTNEDAARSGLILCKACAQATQAVAMAEPAPAVPAQAEPEPGGARPTGSGELSPGGAGGTGTGAKPRKSPKAPKQEG